jgi:hypothetical protein
MDDSMLEQEYELRTEVSFDEEISYEREDEDGEGESLEE